MKSFRFISVFIIVIFFMICSSGEKVEAWPASNNSDIKILIDPGHGGIDGGAVAQDGTLEKHINLKISQKLKKALEKEKYTIIMTREEDKGLYTDGGKIRKKKLEDLHNRQKMIRDTNCDVFVSIHLNMFPQQQYYGAQVWYAGNEKSRKLGLLTQDNLIQDLDVNNKREAKAAKESYIILRNPPDIPLIIIECGFLSNAAETAKLKDDGYQEKVANSIARTLKEYLEKKQQ
ncbi:MAG: N-acetylmuramoyl-L-alanine amidase CwlD [Bacillota bacterium]|nr:N-acetylmuramoyl-L-alanine amidase CwlD [Bacillota bacterium]